MRVKYVFHFFFFTKEYNNLYSSLNNIKKVFKVLCT